MANNGNTDFFFEREPEMTLPRRAAISKRAAKMKLKAQRRRTPEERAASQGHNKYPIEHSHYFKSDKKEKTRSSHSHSEHSSSHSDSKRYAHSHPDNESSRSHSEHKSSHGTGSDGAHSRRSNSAADSDGHNINKEVKNVPSDKTAKKASRTPDDEIYEVFIMDEEIKEVPGKKPKKKERA